MVLTVQTYSSGGQYACKFNGEYIGNDLIIIILACNNGLTKWPLLTMQTNPNNCLFVGSMECTRVIESGSSVTGTSSLKGSGLNIDDNGATYNIDFRPPLNSPAHFPYVARYIYPVMGKLVPTTYLYSSFQSQLKGGPETYEVRTGGVLVIDLFHVYIEHFTPDVLRAMNLSRFELVDKYFK